MKRPRTIALALAAISVLVFPEMEAATQSPDRIPQIQRALSAAHLDGWLFYDIRGSAPLALRVLQLDKHAVGSRRWFYFIPAEGECRKIVHRIEPAKLASLPGQQAEYSSWKELQARLREALPNEKKKARIAMQYSPMNDIPYMSRVDAGTVELVRSLGAEVVSSAELVQQFEAVLTPEQKQSHVEGSDKLHRVLMDAFAEIARNIRAEKPITEYDIQQFISRRLQ